MLLNFLSFILFLSPFKPEEEIQTTQAAPVETCQVASLWLIALHQNFLTHIDGPRSHFIPCSSTFMKQAIMKYGFFKGSLLGLDRLLQENKDPWIYPRVLLDEGWIKTDPVP